METNAEAGRGVQILISCLLIKALCDGDEADWETLKVLRRTFEMLIVT